MKGLTKKYCDPKLIKIVISDIEDLSHSLDEIKIIHLCGTHEYSIVKHGLRSLLPKNVKLVSGPGCPVCVTPAGHIDAVIDLALSGVEIFTFGDMVRVPASVSSLQNARGRGGKVNIVYGIDDAVKRAWRKPDQDFVFFAIGFETTAPTTAVEVHANRIPKNLSLLVSHRLMPPITEVLLGMGNLPFLGLICPGHVSTIIGAKPWEIFPKSYQMPTVVAGFEPLDILIAIKYILEQLVNKKPELVNEYTRAVHYEGNKKAKRLLKETFDIVDGYWRGIGVVPSSAYVLKDDFKKYDATIKYELDMNVVGEDLPAGCMCHHVVIGRAIPTDCPLFMKKCTSSSPYGTCMVSSEGTCSTWAKYGGEANEIT